METTRTKTSQAYSKGQGNPNQANYTMLYNGAIAFDFAELQAFNDDCMLVVLPRNFIALLESVLRFADGSPHLWRDVAGRKDPKWQEVRQFIANGRACLLMGCKVVDLNDSLREMVGVQKHILAALTDGIVRDFYYDPGHPEDFAAKVGVPVSSLPTWNLNPLDGDILHPNMESFDSIGTNTIIDPATGLPVKVTSRRQVEEVPSVFIYDGWTDDMTMADLYVDTMYQNIWPKVGEPPTGTIPFTDALIENMERQDLALRHINAKLSRSGRVELNLQDEPQVRDPLTGKRMILTDFFAQNGLAWPVGAWPLMAFTHPSVFTAGAPNAQDVLGVMEGQLALDSWLGDSTARGLLAGFRPTIRLTEGLAPILTFPAINFPLPGTLGTIQIPPIPLFAGTYDMYIPGDGGRGLADQLKLEEDKVEKIIDVPGIGNVAMKWDMNRLMVKIPALPALPGVGALPTMLTNAFGRRYLMGLLPGVWTQIFPYIRTSWHQAIYDQTRLQEPGLAQAFKNILQIQVPNPAYNPSDPANVQPPTIDGKTLAQLFWIEKQTNPDPFGKIVGGESFAELFWIKPTDPNYRANIQSHAQILNFMQIQVEQTLRDLIQELHDCCGKATLEAIKTLMDSIAQSAAEMTLTHNALAKIQLLQYSSISGEEVALDLAAINAIPPTLKTTAPNPLTEVTEQLVKAELLNYSGLTGEEVDMDLADAGNILNSTSTTTSSTPFYLEQNFGFDLNIVDAIYRGLHTDRPTSFDLAYPGLGESLADITKQDTTAIENKWTELINELKACCAKTNDSETLETLLKTITAVSEVAQAVSATALTASAAADMAKVGLEGLDVANETLQTAIQGTALVEETMDKVTDEIRDAIVSLSQVATAVSGIATALGTWVGAGVDAVGYYAIRNAIQGATNELAKLNSNIGGPANGEGWLSWLKYQVWGGTPPASYQPTLNEIAAAHLQATREINEIEGGNPNLNVADSIDYIGDGSGQSDA